MPIELLPTSDAVMNANLSRITQAIGTLEAAGGEGGSALADRVTALETAVADLTARVEALEAV